MLIRFPCQVSGHKNEPIMMDESDPSLLYKPIKKKPASSSSQSLEVAFYQYLSSTLPPDNRRIFPQFHRIDSTTDMLVLENLVHPFPNPLVADIKMGKRFHDFEASEAKREKMQGLSRTTLSGIKGFRLTGIRKGRNGGKFLGR